MEENPSSSKRHKLSLDDANGAVQLVREQPPEHCILKIDSFSEIQAALSKSTKDHIDSIEFKAGGYTWMLSVYPNGNKEEGGADHLSLYVALVDKLDSGTFVNALLRFFIYDQIRDNYLTFTDLKDKRFHALKTTWGIPKLLPLDSFANASNGFLVNDSCVFGAEILLRSGGQIKRSIVSHLESEYERSYTWKIKNFSAVLDDLYSPVFSFGEWSWKLQLYPKGDSRVSGKYLSLFLVLNNANELTRARKLYTQYSLCIKKQVGDGADHKKVGCRWFLSESSSWGFSSFISINDLYSTSKGFLVGDTLILEVMIEEMLLVKDMDLTPEPSRKGEQDDKFFGLILSRKGI